MHIDVVRERRAMRVYSRLVRCEWEKRVARNEKVNYFGKTSSLELINALRNLFNII